MMSPSARQDLKAWLVSLCLSIAVLCSVEPCAAAEAVKTSVCDISRHASDFDGKLVQIRALVVSGVEDLPAGVADDQCAAELKFFQPDDAHFAQLLKSKNYRKLLKEVKRNPKVEATVTGLYKRFGTADKPDNRLALESVENVVVIPQPRIQKR